MNSSQKWVNRSITFLAIILILALTACGVQSQAAPEPDEVSLQLNWIYQTQFAGYFVAEKQGFYRDEILKVKINPGDGTFRPIDKLVSGEVDFAIATDAIEVLQAREAGQPVIAVAAIYQQNANVWVSLAEKNIKTPEDMIGKRAGIRPVGEVPYRMLLAAAGIERDKIKEVTVNDFTIRPLLDDEVDVIHDYALSGPLVAKRQGYELNIISLADEDIFLPNDLLVVREDLIQTNPELVKRFVQASLKGWNTVAKEPNAGVEATLQFDETLDTTQQTDMMEAAIALVSPETAPIGYMDEKMWQQVMQLALDQGLISKPLELDKVYTTQFLEE